MYGVLTGDVERKKLLITQSLDSFHVVENKLIKLKVRLEILNFFNDQRPLIIHQITVKDSFLTTELFKDFCDGANWNPNRPLIKEVNGFTKIPIVNSVEYLEKDNLIKSKFIKKEEYIRIENNKEFIVDFVFWSKESQTLIKCIEKGCDEECYRNTIIRFQKGYSWIELIVDKPDFDDNNNVNVLFGQKDLIDIERD